MVLTRARSSRSKRSVTPRREIAPFGVQVVVIEPGAVRMKIAGRAIATANEVASNMTPEQSQRYGGLVQAGRVIRRFGPVR
jgi:NAD(P)-dependent dehydrogenase (short-subunit alcohol dehydrogenase family)